MGTLGAYLRDARQARGQDLRDAAQQTRISFNYLKAIEDEDFARLPGEVFVKGFLKNYARYLQLPEEEVLRRYAELRSSGQAAGETAAARTAALKPVEPAPRPAPGPEPAAPRSTTTNLEPFLWSGAVIIAVIAFILIAIPDRRAPGERSAKVATAPAATGTQASSPTPTGRAEKLYLDITALENVWILVRTDASPQKKAVLQKGEKVTWTADERFVLSYGSIGAVNLVLNGKELTVSGARNAIVRDLIVTAAGIAVQKTDQDQLKKPKPKIRTTPASTLQGAPQLPASGQQAPPTPVAPAVPPGPAVPETVAPPAPAPAPQLKPSPIMLPLSNPGQEG